MADKSPDREALEIVKLTFEAERTKAEARKAEAEALDMEHAAALKALQLAKAQREEDLLAVSDDSNFTYTFDQGVDEESVGALLETVNRWDRVEPESDWHIVLNSPGGYVNEGMHLLDTLVSFSKRGGGEHHITMTVRGMAASMAGILLQAADQRLMGPHSMLLIHQISGGVWDSVELVKDTVAKWDIQHEQVVDLFVGRSDGRISKKKFRREWNRRDWWIPAGEALKVEAGLRGWDRMTERELLDALHDKLDSEAQGNGGNRWIVAEKVRSSAGFDASRIADAIAIDTWPSKGLEIHGFEVKCSRSDWLTELKCPEKSEPFRRFCDRWWLVTATKDIVKPGELPEGWGHMALAQTYVDRHVGQMVWLPEWRASTWAKRGDRSRARVPSVPALRRIKPAPKMPDRDPVEREMLATIMRAVSITADRRAEKRKH